MKKVIYICDMCGAETQGDSFPDEVKLYTDYGHLDRTYELCRPCYKKLIKTFGGYSKKEGEDESRGQNNR